MITTVDDVARPEIAANQVLVEVHAAGANPFDWKVREGLVRAMAELTFPAVLGGDVAGTVSAVGDDVTNVKVGDAVYGLAGAMSSHGSFAEYTPVAASNIALKPAKLGFVEAAALPLVGLSAIQALVETLDLQPGQKVLIHGGAGGIGTVSIQLAKHLGAHVATTADTADSDFLKSLGAAEVIDYKTQKFAEILSGYDAVFDTIGGETFTDSFKILKPGGAIVSMAAQPNPELDQQYAVTSHGQFTQATPERLAKLTQLIDAGVITAQIDKVFPITEAGDALGYLQTGQHRGKVVIKVRD